MHVATALSGSGYEPVFAVPPGAVPAGAAAFHEIGGLSTFPRTLNVMRLGAFLHDHLAAASEIEAFVRAEGVRAVYSISEATFAGSLAARRLGVPSFVHVIGMSIASPRTGAHIYIRLLDRLTTHFVACSSAVAEMLETYGVDEWKISVVHNGIPVGAIVAALDGRRPEVGTPPRIGMVAAYDPRKGHELFIEAAARVIERFPGARFFLIGGVLEGHEESVAFERRMADLIRELGLDDRFVRPGFVPQPDVYRWVCAMDVIVVPSKTEAFAHALPEAMVCGVPVVATAVEGNLDAFVDRHSGLYVRPDAGEIAGAVIELLGDPARARRLGNAARERARLFDLAVTLPALADVVNRVLAREAVREPARLAL